MKAGVNGELVVSELALASVINSVLARCLMMRQHAESKAGRTNEPKDLKELRLRDDEVRAVLYLCAQNNVVVTSKVAIHLWLNDRTFLEALQAAARTSTGTTTHQRSASGA
jgi:hypothetical protein